jgi:hypothetical protein
MTEKLIEQNILSFLRECGCSVDKINNVGIYDEKRKTYRTPGRNYTPGIADIVGCIPNGKFLAIEVKSKVGRPTPAQLAYITGKQRSKGIAFISRSVEQTYDQLEKFWPEIQDYKHLLRKYMIHEN